jgi:hypothetical protein
MRAVARFAMRGHWYAVGLVVAGLIFSTVISIFGVISGSLVALVTMRISWLAGLRLSVASAFFFCVLEFLMSGQITYASLYISVVFLGLSICLGIVLDRSGRQSSPLLLLATLLILFSCFFRILTGDADQFWYHQITPILEVLQGENSAIFSEQAIVQMSSQMQHVFLVMMFLTFVAIIFLSRWWQAELYNPGGFGFEFRAIKMPKVALYGVTIAGAAVTLNTILNSNMPIVTDCFIILVLLFAFQGLAVVHAKAYTTNLSNGWMISLYVSLVVVPQFVGLVLATTGVADSLADFRRAKV